MDFMFHGQRIRESTGMPSKARAREVHDKRKQGLRDGLAGIRPQPKAALFATAVREFQQSVELANSNRTNGVTDEDAKQREVESEKKRQKGLEYRLGKLMPYFGNKLLVDIDARDIAKYQSMRLAQGVANATVNREVAVLRQVMRKKGLWARIACDVKMLPEPKNTGHALSIDEERILLIECRRSKSRLLLPFVLISIETGARFNTIRRLRWKELDVLRGCLKFGKDKTQAGTGRVIPLSRRAKSTLQRLADEFPNLNLDHYVFPYEGRNGQLDPTRPFRSPKKAWATAKTRTRNHCEVCRDGINILVEESKRYICNECGNETEQLPVGLTRVRMHDLRHTAVSRMIAAGIPLPMIGKIVGWSAGTLALMIARYGHFGLEEMRIAVEAISGNDEGLQSFAVGPPADTDLEDGQERSSPEVASAPRAASKYDRDQLYEKVWKMPVRIVAKEYGVSDVAIGKVCRKLRVPLPGRGYWAKHAANRPVPTRPSLPSLPA